MSYRPIPRRTFLKSAGVSLALPALDLMATPARAGDSGSDIRRMIAICAPLGLHVPNFFPASSGTAFTPSRYLQPLERLRHKYSVMSGLMHPMVDGGHAAEKSFLTAAAHPGQPSFRNTISLDQFAAERIGHHTRFPFLTLVADGGGIAYTRAGVQVPAESRPSRVFQRLFLDGTPQEKEKQMRRIRDGRSVLDLVRDQAQSLRQQSSRRDDATLDQYFTSVRELETRLAQAEDWAQRPKPQVDVPPPTDIEDRANFTGRMQLLLDLMFLALQTDSTRLITLKGPGGNEVVQLPGVDDGWHNLSHHGKDPDKIEQLAIIEEEEMRLFAQFVQRLDNVTDGEHTLLDQTAILLGSNLGNASSHNNSNLPILVAGGRFRHGQHLAFPQDNPPPLADLFVSLLQHLKLEVTQFATGQRPLANFDLA